MLFKFYSKPSLVFPQIFLLKTAKSIIILSKNNLHTTVQPDGPSAAGKMQC